MVWMMSRDKKIRPTFSPSDRFIRRKYHRRRRVLRRWMPYINLSRSILILLTSPALKKASTALSETMVSRQQKLAVLQRDTNDRRITLTLMLFLLELDTAADAAAAAELDANLARYGWTSMLQNYTY